MLPVAVILETGNHVGRIEDGNVRRNRATKMCALVALALEGKAPFVALGPLKNEQIGAWFSEFAEWVTPQEHSLTDLTIKQVWAEQCELHRARRVYSWSLDGGLAHFDRAPEWPSKE